MFVKIILLVGLAVLVWSASARSSQAHGAEAGRDGAAVPDALDDRRGELRRRRPRRSVWRIEQANHLAGADIQPGEKLVLP